MTRFTRVLAGRSQRSDAGFTLVELMVASGVMATALAMLAAVVTAGLTTTAYARERQSGSQLANQTLEQIRSLPFATVQSGLQGAGTNDDLIAHPDSNITSSGCGTSYCFGGERIAMHTGGANVDPLVPHQKTIVVGPTTFTVSTYATNYQNDPTSGAVRATVSVTWHSLKSTTGNVQAQTVIFASPTSAGGTCTNCLTNHPFQGPSLPSFAARAHQTAGTVSVTGTIGGVGLDHATLYSGRVVEDATIEQVSHVQGTTQAAGATAQVTGGDEQSIGRTAASSKADDDPALGTSPVYDTEALSPPAAQSLAVTLGADSLTESMTGGGSGTTTSTTSACTNSCSDPATPTPRNCPNLTGYTNETDGLHCGGSNTTSGSLNAQASLGAIGTAVLASLGAQATPAAAVIDQKTSTGGTTCTTMPSPPTDGCVRASVTRSAVDMSAGALPSNLNALLKPLGFTYFAQITGVQDTVAAEAGPGAGAPSATQTAGSIKVYCASAILGNLLCPVTGYVTKTLSQITSAVTTPTLSITDALLAGGTTITLSATVTPGSTAATSTGSPISEATATSTPPTVSVAFKIVAGGNTIIDTTILLDPGALTAEATYAPAQS